MLVYIPAPWILWDAIQDAITLQYPESQAVLFSEGRLASRHGILCWYPSVETGELRAVQTAAAFTR